MINDTTYIRDLLVERYKSDLYRFFCDAWKVVEPETKYVENWHIKYLCGLLMRIFHQVNNREKREQHTIINIPPGTTKSLLISVIFPVWIWLHNPAFKLITTSFNASLAIKFATLSRDIIISEWFQSYFGHIFELKYDVNKKSEYATDRGGMRKATGVLGGITGTHADIFTVDDASDPKRALSIVESYRINKWWDITASTRLTDLNVSHKIIVMQRQAVNDLPGYCLANKHGQYNHINLPAEIVSGVSVKPSELKEYYTENLLDVRRLNKSVLNEMKINLGTAGYAAQYLQNPSNLEASLVKPEWFQQFTMEQLTTSLDTITNPIEWHLFVDGAYTEEKLNDPTALLCATKRNNQIYIRDVQRVWMELPDLIRYIPEFLHRNGGTSQSKIYVEPKASGLSIVQTLRKNTGLNVIADKSPTTSKLQRFKSCLPFMESGRVHLLTQALWQDMFIEEVLNFPEGEYKDLTDVLVMAISQVDSGVLSGKLIDIAMV